MRATNRARSFQVGNTLNLIKLQNIQTYYAYVKRKNRFNSF